jgi:hypothetical protein
MALMVLIRRARAGFPSYNLLLDQNFVITIAIITRSSAPSSGQLHVLLSPRVDLPHVSAIVVFIFPSLVVHVRTPDDLVALLFARQDDREGARGFLHNDLLWFWRSLTYDDWRRGRLRTVIVFSLPLVPLDLVRLISALRLVALDHPLLDPHIRLPDLALRIAAVAVSVPAVRVFRVTRPVPFPVPLPIPIVVVNNSPRVFALPLVIRRADGLAFDIPFGHNGARACVQSRPRTLCFRVALDPAVDLDAFSPRQLQAAGPAVVFDFFHAVGRHSVSLHRVIATTAAAVPRAARR